MFIPPLALLLALSSARAAEQAPVLRVEGPEAYTALGVKDGLARGNIVYLYRRVVVTDPSTGRTLTDTFLLGRGAVIEVGDTLARLGLPHGVASQLQAGDLVRMSPREETTGDREVAAAPVAPPTGTPPTAASAAPPPAALTAEASSFQDAFTIAARLPRDRRAPTWEAWLAAHPNSPMVTAVRSELSSLKLEQQSDSSGPATPSERRVEAPVSAPSEVRAHASPTVVLSLPDLSQISTATLFYRHQGEETYRYRSMRPIGDTALAAAIPAEAVLEPAVEWFIELHDQHGKLGRSSGTALAPSRIRVEPKQAPIETVGRSAAQLTVEYVDFYAGTRSDYYTHGEADFLYRLRRGPLYSLRVGAGTYRGRGAPTEALDAVPKAEAAAISEPVGYNFGYNELELRLTPWIALIGRGVIGVDYAGLAGGAAGRVRLGREDGTSLEAGAARIGNIGAQYGLRLGWSTIERLPMAASVEMTDLPGRARADGPDFDDYGVRLLVDARYAITPHFELGGRVGYQLRNIDHAGLSGGLQTVFSW